jgi:uncharacterized membrane protein YeaQ/YmgE (transglycosylase-associated protein family)
MDDHLRHMARVQTKGRLIMESLLPIIINLVSGAVGGNVAGSVLKEQSLGTVGNSIAGILGGGIGGQILSMVLGAGSAKTGLDLGSIISSVASGGVGGVLGLFIIGFIKSKLSG